MALISDVKSEFPMLRTPISLIIDDWTFGYLGTERDIPLDLEFKRASDFLLDMIGMGRDGVRGKLSLVPYLTKPRGNGKYEILGCISRGLKGIPREKIQWMLRLIRDEASRYFDITPEILTHQLVLDIETGRLMDETEWEWSQRQSLESLTRYIAHALSVLREAGIIANGVTSPCNFGVEVEGLYAKAVLEAEKTINNIGLTWYFLHVEPNKRVPFVNPRLMYLDEDAGEAVVSVVSCSGDCLARSRVEEADGDIHKIADSWISSDGKSGRLIDLYNDGAYLIFHTHWHNTHRIDDDTGFRALKETIHRIKRNLGDNVVWMRCSEIARYFAASKTFKPELHESPEGAELRLNSPFNCSNFTFSMKTSKEIRRIKINDIPIKRTTERLKPNSWMIRKDRIYVCTNIKRQTKIKITPSN